MKCQKVSEKSFQSRKDLDVSASLCPTGRTALHCAAHNGHRSVAELLLAKGATVDAPDGEGPGLTFQQ